MAHFKELLCCVGIMGKPHCCDYNVQQNVLYEGFCEYAFVDHVAGKDDEVVKLYDLTSLCTDVMDEKGPNPFTVPVAMLLYR
jgi:hypothetical protein